MNKPLIVKNCKENSRMPHVKKKKLISLYVQGSLHMNWQVSPCYDSTLPLSWEARIRAFLLFRSLLWVGRTDGSWKHPEAHLLPPSWASQNSQRDSTPDLVPGSDHTPQEAYPQQKAWGGLLAGAVKQHPSQGTRRSVGTGSCPSTWPPEFDPREPCKGRRELSTKAVFCVLHVFYGMCAHPPQIKGKEVVSSSW